MDQPVISILMPVKNTGVYLKECLQSILNQTFRNWELIAVDDNSQDMSFDVLSNFSKIDSRVTVLHNSGTGIIDALRLAYQHSSGTFITRMDSDDIMEVDKLELMHYQLKLKGEGHIAVGLVNYFSAENLGEGYRNYATWLNKLTSNESNFLDIYKECSIPSPCWMVSRLDFDRCGGFSSDVYPEDYDLAFRFRKIALKITAINKTIHQWRDYKSRTSRIDKNYSDNRFAELKIMYFLDQDLDSTIPLILWGAGNKGKKIASLLTDEGIQFQWVCNNPKKIGKDIYGIVLQDLPALSVFSNAQIIVAVSSPKDSNEVEKLILENSQHRYFRFS